MNHRTLAGSQKCWQMKPLQRIALHALLRITTVGEERAVTIASMTPSRRSCHRPASGRGPGIGGFKRESEIGTALHEGHPVYFVSFFSAPSN
jgi:hypothetical protein